MATKSKPAKRTTAPKKAARTKKRDRSELADLMGNSGELHQIANDADVPTLTTQQGIPVSDDQNTLRQGQRGPALIEDFANDAFAHCKFIGYSNEALPFLQKAGIGSDLDDGCFALGDGVAEFVDALAELRYWPREANVDLDSVEQGQS